MNLMSAAPLSFKNNRPSAFEASKPSDVSFRSAAPAGLKTDPNRLSWMFFVLRHNHSCVWMTLAGHAQKLLLIVDFISWGQNRVIEECFIDVCWKMLMWEDDKNRPPPSKKNVSRRKFFFTFLGKNWVHSMGDHKGKLQLFTSNWAPPQTKRWTSRILF